MSGKRVEVRAKMAGVFYRRPGPDEPNYVEIGDIVKKKQVLALLETMKVFQKVKSPAAGTIVEIIAENVYIMEKQDLSDEILNDIISEMINIIAGSLMRLWTPPSQIFQLGLPTVGQESFLQIDINKDSLEFDMEGNPFWLVMRGEVFTEPPAGN